MVGLIKIGVFDVAFNKSMLLIHRMSCQSNLDTYFEK